MDAAELDTLTDKHLPLQFQRSALKAVFAARNEAHIHCAEYDQSEAENVRPFVTRGKLEGLLRGAAQLVPGCSSKVIKQKGQFWNHTEFHSGPIILTAHAVQTPCELVDDAEYRRTLAESNYGSIFEDDDGFDDPSTRVYVVLLHGRFRGRTLEDCTKYGHLPGSAYLAYPSADMMYYRHKVNLFVKFPDIIEDHMPQEWDQAARARYLRYADRRTA